MTFTYDASALSESTAVGRRYVIRLLIGDTDTAVAATNKRLEDEEIDFYLARWSNKVLPAAVEALEALIAKWAHREVGTTSGTQSSRFDWLQKRAAQLRDRLSAELSPVSTGASVDDHESAKDDDDRVQPAFERGLLDNPEAGVADADDMEA